MSPVESFQVIAIVKQIPHRVKRMDPTFFKQRCHIPSALAFSALCSNWKEFTLLIGSKVSCSKIQCNAENAWINGMWQLGKTNFLWTEKKSFCDPKYFFCDEQVSQKKIPRHCNWRVGKNKGTYYLPVFLSTLFFCLPIVK